MKDPFRFYGLKKAASTELSPQTARVVRLSNRISLIVSALSFLAFIIYATFLPWTEITTAIPIIALLALVPLVLNKSGYTRTSRIWISILFPIGLLKLSLISKNSLSVVPSSEYYSFRLIMLAAGAFPSVLFSLREKTLLILTLAINFAALMLFDVIHNWLGVGYFQVNTTGHDNTYYYINLTTLIAFLYITGSLIFLKRDSESMEDNNTKLIDELNSIKKKLEERADEVEAQNQEILAQSDVLHDRQIRLFEAYELIEQQKSLLSRENKNLEDELLQSNRELVQTNSELVKYNTELRQFSFTVSHNLRGPVASLLGLIDLIDTSQMLGTNAEIMGHINKAVQALDEIIKDLNKIIDIRHDIFRIRQRVDVHKEIEEIRHLFRKKLEDHSIEIHEDLRNEVIYSVKPMVHSILYNLLSNSIKYRAPDRTLNVVISSWETPEDYVLQVMDNGLGIDLERHRENLFKLYKRFHLHTEGKGLGLYLVKLQCESLGGHIDVESKLNQFSTFRISLKKPENINRQVLYNESDAEIFYDARINSMGVIWHGPITGEQYRNSFNKCLEFLKIYSTPNWISDISNQGPVADEDQHWFITEVIPAATRMGLRRVAAVKANATNDQIIKYVETIKRTTESLGLQTQFFLQFEDAEKWIQQENERSFTGDINLN